MDTLGEDLRAAREGKGLTLRQVSEKTRISATFLKALEDGDYSVLPGDVFVVGFLRNYSRELGLDEDEIVARYRERQGPRPEAVPAQVPSEGETMSAAMKAGMPLPAKKTPIYVILIAGLALGGLVAAAALYLTRGGRPAAPPPPAGHAPVAAPLKAMTTAAPGPMNMYSIKPREAAIPPKKEKGRLRLRLTAESASWYSYRADNGAGESGILKAGESLEVRADARIILSLGNAGGVRVEFGGRQLKPFGGEGEAVKGIVFTNRSGGMDGYRPAQKRPFKGSTQADIQPRP